MQLHALWWWIDRWRKSTAYMDMTLEQQGAYRNLLDEGALRGGPIPNDERVLAKACGDAKRWPKVRAVVLARFHLVDGAWHNTTLDEVLKQSARRAEKQRRWRQRQAGHSASNDDGHTAGNKPGSPISYLLSPDVQTSTKSVTPARVEQALQNAKSSTAKLELTVSLLADTVDEGFRIRAGALLERYKDLFTKHCHGARYHNRMHLDFDKALGLVRTWPDDARLEKLAVLVLTTDDDWIAGTDRGFGVFAAKASWADKSLAAWEAEHGLQAH